jgi:hypothetical protein
MKNLIVFHKNLMAIFLLIGLFVFAAAAQNTGNTKRAVKGRVLISESAPEIRLKFGKKFKFEGNQEFVLYDRANAEQYFFVESENKKIKRLFMLQFESFLPGIDGKYDYNEPGSVTLGGLKYFSNSENIPNVEAALKAVPDSDIAKAAEFLQEKGFVLMKSLKYQRFVRVLDDAKRSEFILLYVEDAETPNDNGDLQNRALANFKILK